MASLFPNTMIPSSFTPEQVMSKLVYLELQSHFNHLNTTSYEEHKALDVLYSGIQDFRDTIMELILGYIAPARMMNLPLIPIDINKSNTQLAQEVMDFGNQLHRWAESRQWMGLANISDDVEALGTKVKYLLTLS